MTPQTNAATAMSEHDLISLGTRAFQGLGLPQADAEDVAKVLVLADLFGLSTHGLSRIESYGDRLKVGGINPTAQVSVNAVASAIRLVDGDNGVGPLVGMHALRAAMEAAKACGVGVAFARGSNHFGPISPYSLIAAEAGFASIIGSNATTTIAPWGGSDARLGNSPIGFGVPNPGGQPFLLDMAMSVVARAKIRNALKQGAAIPDTWATDKDGRATTDPKAALDGFLLPVGGHKGYGLALMVDLFAGLLSNAAYLTHVKSWVDAPDEPQNLGHFFILIDTSVLGSTAWLTDRMNDFASILHGSPAVEADKPVIVPGEIELKKLARHRAEGFVPDPAVLAQLQECAALTK
ncbi:Ldh family oxidoreductase [Pigmentiphaga litoralis]|uniref:LDH2 family malate/lactate/ureidoglycolate dehydrogenase n=1 Tax=Pigmentiphaga litoralis TaxID=516702 RepID=A0A7Y9LL76_9BURK|nr:LDH2 family malate/lactate/ureidoglycolate dehydrogenase [Pigmentiphaga litoralis]NYE80773.1 LDH2 family malate/lactate/ureidoglycolate dehydrogenase [Pigmentiphaga litoralis]